MDYPRTIAARFAGWCADSRQGCPEPRIQVGDPITQGRAGGSWFCASCAEKKAAQDAEDGGQEAAQELAENFDDFVPSSYQLAIREALTTTQRHIVVDAVAGSGKSVTLRWLLRTVPKAQLGRVMFCAFGNAIAKAMRAKVDPSVPVKTLNSIGHGLVARHLGGEITFAEDRKVGKIIRKLYPVRGPEADRLSSVELELHEDLYAPTGQLARLCKSTLVASDDRVGLLELIDRYGIQLEGRATTEALLAAVDGVLREDLRQAVEEHVVDFGDQLWLPHMLRLSAPQLDTLMVDEVQDLNRAQHELVSKLTSGGGRVVAVGDPWQSIFGFRGADLRSMPDLVSRLSATSRGVAQPPLSVCYRCPTSHLDIARRIVPHIEAAPGAKTGELAQKSVSSYLDSLTGGARDLVLSRTNAPLVGMAFALIRRGIAANIVGRDLASGLLSMIAKLERRDVESLSDLLKAFAAYEERETTKLRAAGKLAAAAAVEDKVATLVALTDGVDTISDLRDRIDQVFCQESGPGVTLSTVHRAKGLEAEHVALLGELLPGPWAIQDWEQQQEQNLVYVAFTRSLSSLTVLGATPPVMTGSNPPEPQDDDDTPRPSGGSSPESPAPAPTPEPITGLQELAVSAETLWPLNGQDVPSELPAWPSKGSGEYTPPSLEDWEDIRDAYLAAGVEAKLAKLERWQQYALLVGRCCRVSTTVNCRGNGAREKGANAVDVVRVNSADGPPLRGSQRKVLRRDGWQGRVAERINQILKLGG